MPDLKNVPPSPRPRRLSQLKDAWKNKRSVTIVYLLLRRLVRLAMGLTGGFSLLVGAALVLFGKDAAILLYHDAQAGRYVQVLGFVAPFMYLESMVDAILKGMGEQLATFRYSVLDSILRIAGILWLMPQYGMPGFLAVMTASNLLTCGLNTGRMVKKLGSRS